MDSVEIVVENRVTIDLDGNAAITDRKIVKNLTGQEQRLQGPFKQTIHSEIDHIVGSDSDGNSLTCLRNPDPSTHELELHFAPPSEHFIIPPNATKWFEIRYDAYSYACRMGDGLLFRIRSGNLRYQTPAFSHFSFAHTYEFDLRSGRNLVHRLFNRYDARLIGFNGTVAKKHGKLIVQTSGTLDKQEAQTNTILLEPQYRKSLAVLVGAAGGAGLRSVIQWLLELLRG